MKTGHTRSYGTILTGQLMDEKCTTRASPCVRYFIDAEGERVSNPEEFATGGALITPTEYRKRVDNLPKRDELGKFVKKSAEGKEQALGASKEDEGRIVRGGGKEGLEKAEVNKDDLWVCGDCMKNGVECDKPYDEDCVRWSMGRDCALGVTNKGACRVVTNNPVEETKDDLKGLAEPEPAWTPEYAGECRNAPTMDEIIEKKCKIIKDGLTILQGMYIRKAKEDFAGRVREMMGAL